ncbi:MAG: phage tail tape measure protein [Shimia sp.]
MTDFDFDDFDRDLGGLSGSLGEAQAMTAAFGAELASVRNALAVTTTDLRTFEKGLDKGLRKAFDGVIFGGASLSDALRGLAQSMIDTTYNAAMKPITAGLAGAAASGLGSLLGVPGFAQGGAFAQGQVMPFAKGGVIGQATAFPMKTGIGVMGEAGPEALMPLTRGADGALGVRAQGGGRPVTVNMTINTPDVQGFQRSSTQVAAQINRALARGNRNA